MRYSHRLIFGVIAGLLATVAGLDRYGLWNAAAEIALLSVAMGMMNPALAEQYMFVPQCAVVPASTPVRFRLTSADVTHGFFVQSTNTNAMVVPGYVTSVRTSFESTGTYQMPCDEFCGFGHHAMAARIVVVPRDQFKNLRPDERMNCGTQ